MDQDLFATDGGVYFGYGVDTPRYPLPEGVEEAPLRYAGDRHILTFAPSGSGKSRRLLLSNILQLPNWSLFILDVKGELAFQTRRFREYGVHNEVVQFNPFKILGMPSNGFNPVAALDPKSETFIDEATGLSEALIRSDGRDQHWVQSAQDLLCALIMYSRIRGKDGGSLGHVREMLGASSEEFVVGVEAMTIAGIEDNVEEIGIKMARYADLKNGNRELSSIISTALAQTRFLDSKPMKAELARGGFNFAQMKQRPVTTYINLPADKISTHSSYLRLLLTSFFQDIYRDRSESRVPILLMLDEAAVLGALGVLHDAIPLVRSYGVKLFQLFQDVPQCQAIYGNRFMSLVANSGVLQGFAAQDMHTAKLFSDRSGQGSAYALSTTASADIMDGDPKPASFGLGFVSVPNVLPQDVTPDGMDFGFSILYSHLTRGRIWSHVPDPSEVPIFAELLDRSTP